MRRSLIVSLLILAFTAAVGGTCEWYNGDLARRYAEGLLSVSEALSGERWEEAGRQVSALSQRWNREKTWVQLWVNHAETDAVTYALRGLEVSIRERDRLSAWLYYGESGENFAHLHHRDAFTLKNIL